MRIALLLWFTIDSGLFASPSETHLRPAFSATICDHLSLPFQQKQTVQGWIETDGGFSQWKLLVVARALKGNIPGHNKGGHHGILGTYPKIVQDIISQLADLCGASAPLSLATVRCLIIATIGDRTPEIFEHHFKDRSTFCVSNSFCRKFLDKTLAWSMRKGTKAMQKLPKDAEEHSRMTWAPCGAKQVTLIGNEEKRAFTALLAVLAAGDALPVQCMYEGKLPRSTPMLVNTLLQQQLNDKTLDLDTTRPFLQDASIGWIWQGYNVIQNKELILKAWAMCPICGDLNLLYNCDDEEVAEDLELYDDEDMGMDDTESLCKRWSTTSSTRRPAKAARSRSRQQAVWCHPLRWRGSCPRRYRCTG
ncbi:hypothetical protein DFH09DRAFT_1076294 [Mycena vulgaris]|nr:hypothetical protein DFH09DRAFT_1076294 [Mycena vulgaris]